MHTFKWTFCFLLISLGYASASKCSTCMLQSWTTTLENFDASIPTTIHVATDAKLDIVINWIDSNQASLELHSFTQSGMQCGSATVNGTFKAEKGKLNLNFSQHGTAMDFLLLSSSPALVSSRIFNSMILGLLALVLSKSTRSALFIGVLVALPAVFPSCPTSGYRVVFNLPKSMQLDLLKIEAGGDSFCINHTGAVDACDSYEDITSTSTSTSGSTTGSATCSVTCKNGGSCDPSGTGCLCSFSWTGLDCSEPVCTETCKNGGTCSAPDTCTCGPSFTGLICEQPLCSPECQHGGTCYGNFPNAENKCLCPDGYSGADCSQISVATCSPPCQNGGVCIDNSPDTNFCACANGWTGSGCSQPQGSSRIPIPNGTFNHSKNSTNSTTGAKTTSFSWNDQFNGKPYRLNVTVPSCATLGNSTKQPALTVTFISPDALSSVMLMSQYASKCDTNHCDCSAPLLVTADASKMIWTSRVPYTQPEKSFNVYVLYQASSWPTRHQYPEDALPHQFVRTPITCGGGQDGPCNPTNCWISLGNKGCS